jgi:hypothetical protein
MSAEAVARERLAVERVRQLSVELRDTEPASA